MLRKAVLLLILLTGVSLQAQTITLKGKITDQSGKAITGATVKIMSRNLSDTTDATGAYSITATSVANEMKAPQHRNAIFMKNGIITVNLLQPSLVRIEFFDMHGKLLKKVVNNRIAADNFLFDMINSPFAASLMVVRVSTNEQTASFYYVPVNNRYRTFTIHETSSDNRLAKTTAAVDTLQVSALGYKSKMTPINSYNETVDITLELEVAVTCTPSKAVNMSVSGSGPHKVVVETNSDSGIKEGTIYRPEDLGPGKNYPIYIWGEGACSLDGKGNSVALAEIASYGYFIIADGTPGGTGSRPMDFAQIIKPARAYITWAVAENRKPCSVYYHSLDTTKVAGNGFSCGGLFGQAVAADPHTATWGVSSSGSFGNNPDLWNSVHTPVLIEEGNQDATGAYTNGLRDYNGIAPLKWPIMFFSNKYFGHGGDLWNKNGGDFTRINLAWLNWWLKGDTGATGKGVLVGSGCKYCTDNNWEVKSANLP